MKRVILTGATGFVGANLARRLVHDGHEVHLLVREGYNPWRIEAIMSSVRIHRTDLEDQAFLRDLCARIKPQWIFHLAAHGAYSHQTDLHRMIKTNVVGTVNLLQSCMETGFEAFVNTGSSSEYGFKDLPPAENEWLEPNSHYALTKAFATMFCRYTARSNGTNVTTLRLYSVYGPFEEPTRLIPTIITKGLKNELPPLVQPQVARDFVYVDDVVEAYLAAASISGHEPGAVFNVGTGTQTTIEQVVELARRVLNIAAEPRWCSMGDRVWDTGTWVSDNRCIREALGWKPGNTFEQGFRKTTKWMEQIAGDETMRRKYGISEPG